MDGRAALKQHRAVALVRAEALVQNAACNHRTSGERDNEHDIVAIGRSATRHGSGRTNERHPFRFEEMDRL